MALMKRFAQMGMLATAARMVQSRLSKSSTARAGGSPSVGTSGPSWQSTVKKLRSRAR